MDIDLDKTKNNVSSIVRKANLPDDEIVHVHRSGVPCFVDMTAKSWLHWTVSETDKHGPKFVKYKPMPNLWGVK